MSHTLLTHEEAKDLFSEEITVKRQIELLSKADIRLSYIMQTLGKIIGRDWEWYDFDNEEGMNHSGNPVRGNFDKDLYENKINIAGNFRVTKNKNFTNYDQEIPTKWLWTDFENTVKEEVSAFELSETLKQEKSAAERLKIKNGLQEIAETLPKLKTSIYAKIPEDIRNNFEFKSVDQIYKDIEFSKIDKTELEQVKEMLAKQKEDVRQKLTPSEFITIEFKEPQKILHEKKLKEHKNKLRMK